MAFFDTRASGALLREAVAVATVSRKVSHNRGVYGYRVVRADRVAAARIARSQLGMRAANDHRQAHGESELALC